MTSTPEYQWVGSFFREEPDPEEEFDYFNYEEDQEKEDAAPFRCRIDLSSDDRDKRPLIGEHVFVTDEDGAEFIAPILALHKEWIDWANDGTQTPFVVVITENPPWLAETHAAMRARIEAEAVAHNRKMQAREAAGLCPVCGEDNLKNCACVRVQKERAAQEKVRDQHAKEAYEQDVQCEEHNQRAAARLAALTVEAAEAAIEESRGVVAAAGRALRLEKYERAYSPRPGGRRYEQSMMISPFSKWLRKNAPDLVRRAQSLREAAQMPKRRERMLEAISEGGQGVCLACYRFLDKNGHCTYSNKVPDASTGQRKHWPLGADTVAVRAFESRKQMYELVLAEVA